MAPPLFVSKHAVAFLLLSQLFTTASAFGVPRHHQQSITRPFASHWMAMRPFDFKGGFQKDPESLALAKESLQAELEAAQQGFGVTVEIDIGNATPEQIAQAEANLQAELAAARQAAEIDESFDGQQEQQQQELIEPQKFSPPSLPVPPSQSQAALPLSGEGEEEGETKPYYAATEAEAGLDKAMAALEAVIHHDGEGEQPERKAFTPPPSPTKAASSFPKQPFKSSSSTPALNNAAKAGGGAKSPWQRKTTPQQTPALNNAAKTAPWPKPTASKTGGMPTTPALNNAAKAGAGGSTTMGSSPSWPKTTAPKAGGTVPQTPAFKNAAKAGGDTGVTPPWPKPAGPNGAGMPSTPAFKNAAKAGGSTKIMGASPSWPKTTAPKAGGMPQTTALNNAAKAVGGTTPPWQKRNNAPQTTTPAMNKNAAQAAGSSSVVGSSRDNKPKPKPSTFGKPPPWQKAAVLNNKVDSSEESSSNEHSSKPKSTFKPKSKFMAPTLSQEGTPDENGSKNSEDTVRNDNRLNSNKNAIASGIKQAGFPGSSSKSKQNDDNEGSALPSAAWNEQRSNDDDVTIENNEANTKPNGVPWYGQRALGNSSQQGPFPPSDKKKKNVPPSRVMEKPAKQSIMDKFDDGSDNDSVAAQEDRSFAFQQVEDTIEEEQTIEEKVESASQMEKGSTNGFPFSYSRKAARMTSSGESVKENAYNQNDDTTAQEEEPSNEPSQLYASSTVASDTYDNGYSYDPVPPETDPPTTANVWDQVPYGEEEQQAMDGAYDNYDNEEPRRPNGPFERFWWNTLNQKQRVQLNKAAVTTVEYSLPVTAATAYLLSNNAQPLRNAGEAMDYLTNFAIPTAYQEWINEDKVTGLTAEKNSMAKFMTRMNAPWSFDSNGALYVPSPADPEQGAPPAAAQETTPAEPQQIPEGSSATAEEVAPSYEEYLKWRAEQEAAQQPAQPQQPPESVDPDAAVDAGVSSILNKPAVEEQQQQESPAPQNEQATYADSMWNRAMTVPPQQDQQESPAPQNTGPATYADNMWDRAMTVPPPQQQRQQEESPVPQNGQATYADNMWDRAMTVPPPQQREQEPPAPQKQQPSFADNMWQRSMTIPGALLQQATKPDVAEAESVPRQPSFADNMWQRFNAQATTRPIPEQTQPSGSAVEATGSEESTSTTTTMAERTEPEATRSNSDFTSSYDTLSAEQQQQPDGTNYGQNTAQTDGQEQFASPKASTADTFAAETPFYPEQAPASEDTSGDPSAYGATTPEYSDAPFEYNNPPSVAQMEEQSPTSTFADTYSYNDGASQTEESMSPPPVEQQDQFARDLQAMTAEANPGVENTLAEETTYNAPAGDEEAVSPVMWSNDDYYYDYRNDISLF